MKILLISLMIGVVITGCISPYVPQTTSSVEVLSNYPMIRLDGEPIDDAYRMVLTPGQHLLEIQYKTYSNEPVCRFSWIAVGDTRYEVTESRKEHPLMLYRWVYVNQLWSRRTEPLEPISCDSNMSLHNEDP